MLVEVTGMPFYQATNEAALRVHHHEGVQQQIFDHFDFHRGRLELAMQAAAISYFRPVSERCTICG
jgi:hypothetical protein